jgi:ketosteroid isomerase-like protein
MIQDQTELERLNEEYIAAFMQADVDWYQRHLAPDFICIESDATVLGKDEFLRNVSRGPDVKDYKLNKVNVRIYGDAALVQATGLFTRKDGSAGLSRYTDVYVRTGGDWKCVSAQITRPSTMAHAG